MKRGAVLFDKLLKQYIMKHLSRAIRYRIAHYYALTSAFLMILLCSGPNVGAIIFCAANFFIAQAWQKHIRYGRLG